MVHSFETLLLDIDDGVGTLTFNRPDKRNALNLQMCLDLKAAADAITASADFRTILVSANGPTFCAGADLKEREGKDADWVRERRRRSYAAYEALMAIEVPMIAVVDGPCVGSGCEIAAICDFILASEKATFRYPEAQWGTVGATQRLPRIVGRAMAKELLFTGRVMSVDEAKSLGLVNHIFASGALNSEAMTMARQIAKAPPLAMRLAKHCIDRGTETTLERGIAIEIGAVERSLANKEWSAGVQAFAGRKGEKS
jgi:enoyl-CoA hydratase